MSDIALVFFLLVAFQIKHFLADYPLQTNYMLRKFNVDDWAIPLLSHSLVHAGFTLILLSPFISTPWAIGLAAFDAVSHFTMDRIKASPFKLGMYEPSQKAYWNVMGFDQMVHHLTHYIIIGMTLFLIN